VNTILVKTSRPIIEMILAYDFSLSVGWLVIL
jgi:hypothetical protein